METTIIIQYILGFGFRVRVQGLVFSVQGGVWGLGISI